MSEVTITIKDVVEGDAQGIMFDYDIVDDEIYSVAVLLAIELARHLTEILEGDFSEITEDKVH
tara:strand:- start:189 stop:377 length:189 start_codon:yes stop_codon:yes gene_type:complete